METASKVRRFTLNIWGIASLILLVGDYFVSLQGSGRAPLFSTTTNCEQAIVANFGAIVCGVMAMRRGSRWWLYVVLAATWGMIINFLCEV